MVFKGANDVLFFAGVAGYQDYIRHLPGTSGCLKGLIEGSPGTGFYILLDLTNSNSVVAVRIQEAKNPHAPSFLRVETLHRHYAKAGSAAVEGYAGGQGLEMIHEAG